VNSEKEFRPMRSIAIMNQKGGVGKTTTAVNLSAAIASVGHRVCLIDLDPQAHASLHLGVTVHDDQHSVYDVLTNQVPLAATRQQVAENLHLVPAHLNLAAAEMELAGEVGREVILRDELLRDPAAFDYLVLDCPPSLGVLTLNALTAVKEVFLPLQPHFLALHGLSKLLRTIEVVTNRLNPDLKLSGVVMCMYDAGTRLAAEVLRDVEEFFADQTRSGSLWAGARSFDTKIRRNIRLAEAPSFGQSILEYAPHSHGAEDYRNLAGEVLHLNRDQRVPHKTNAAA
jgi:chromosome partitioning protein